MSLGQNATARCRFVAEFIDDAETDGVEFRTHAPIKGERAKVKMIPEFLDVAPSASASDLEIKTFVVLLRNNERIAVRGHGLKFVPNSSNPSDEGSYAVVLYDGDRELFVALVKKIETIGVFADGLSSPERTGKLNAQ